MSVNFNRHLLKIIDFKPTLSFQQKKLKINKLANCFVGTFNRKIFR